VLYLMGGGGCSSSACWGPDPGALNLDGYSAVEFAKEPLKSSLAVFDTDPSSGNPFADANMVLVPYCTGDAHSGTTTRSFDVEGTSKETFFYGARNLELYLRRITPTFRDLDRVFLVGTSAGGAGAKYNYSRVKTALGVRVDSIIDSAPGIDTPSDLANQRAKAELYAAVVPGCPACATATDVHQYNRALDPSSRFAFLSFRYDNATKSDLSYEQFSAALQDYVTKLDEDPAAGALIVNNAITEPLHVVLTRPSLAPQRKAALEFLTEVANGTSFPASRIVPGP
jgi:hypothetical protein